jgi:uncharacterized membrane protein YhdT
VHRRLLLLGAAGFVLGVGFVLADLIAFAAGTHDTPLWLNLGCLLAPVGFAVVLWQGLRSGRAEQRTAWHSLDR